MITVGIRELRRRVSELIRMVREEGRDVEITYRGKPVALIIPVNRKTAVLRESSDWTHLDQLAVKIGARWPEGISAAEAVSEGRE